jgi:flagellar M-ring protein FliF
MEQKADKLLSSLVGDGNARVQVAATINFDKVERTVQAVDPDRQALVTEQKAEVTPTAPQQGAGYTTTSSSFENTHSVESFSGAIGNVTKLTVAVLIADKVTMPAADSTATVPPEPIITARTPEEITRVEMLVKNALGVDSTRGDMISVMSAPFDVPTPMARVDSVVAPNDLVAKLQANPKPIVALAALVVLLIIAMVAINALKPKRTLAEKVALRDAAKYAALLPALEEQAALLAGNQMEEEEVAAEAPQQNVMTLMPTTPAREQAIATMEQRPDTAIRVMRGWIRS